MPHQSAEATGEIAACQSRTLLSEVAHKLERAEESGIPRLLSVDTLAVYTTALSVNASSFFCGYRCFGTAHERSSAQYRDATFLLCRNVSHPARTESAEFYPQRFTAR